VRLFQPIRESGKHHIHSRTGIGGVGPGLRGGRQGQDGAEGGAPGDEEKDEAAALTDNRLLYRPDDKALAIKDGAKVVDARTGAAVSLGSPLAASAAMAASMSE
jgi:hypothetical protein